MLDQPTNPPNHNKQHRGRRRREFFEVFQQSQIEGRFQLVDVGRKLRDLRSERGLSIRDLARKSGLNVNTLSMIENGKNLPSLETLQRLSITLETPMKAFFEEHIPENKIMHYKASQRKSIPFAHGKLEDLGDGMPRRGVEIFLVTLNPHSNSGENLMVHTGREVVYCLEGQLSYTIDDQTFQLEPGDSLFFDAHLPHRWQNTGSIPTRSLLVLCPFDEQDRPTERHFIPQPSRKD